MPTPGGRPRREPGSRGSHLPVLTGAPTPSPRAGGLGGLERRVCSRDVRKWTFGVRETPPLRPRSPALAGSHAALAVGAAAGAQPGKVRAPPRTRWWFAFVNVNTRWGHVPLQASTRARR